MSSEKTAEFFKDKTEEQIMNWMVEHMNPSQIKSCFEMEEPPILPGVPTPSPTTPNKSLAEPSSTSLEDELENLRKFCANKKYVINKIENKEGNYIVYFWYYENRKWNYYNLPLEDFKKDKDGKFLECGEDTVVSSDVLPELKEAYNKMDNLEFNQVKKEYQELGLNTEWVSILLTAIHMQQNIEVSDYYKQLFNYTPVLIEGVFNENIYYYYLINEGGDVRFKYTNISINNFEQDLKDINNELNLNIQDSQSDREDGKRRPKEWIDMIKQAVENIDPSDIETIKEIYQKFPLSKSSPFFMEDLFQVNNFGKYKPNNLDLANYVTNKFGPNTAKLFHAKEFTNKFGYKTVNLVSK